MDVDDIEPGLDVADVLQQTVRLYLAPS